VGLDEGVIAAHQWMIAVACSRGYALFMPYIRTPAVRIFLTEQQTTSWPIEEVLSELGRHSMDTEPRELLIGRPGTVHLLEISLR
jgi:hypothetical protein